MATDHIELPGYAAEIRREHEIRARAFHPGSALPRIAGEEVRPLTLALLLELEGNRVAFINPWKFDSGLELAAECARFIWHISTLRARVPYRWFSFFSDRARRRLIARVAGHEEALGDLRTYLDEALYDAPFSAPGGATPRSFVHWTAAVIDMLGAAGSVLTRAEILATPLAQLWQLYRLAAARVNESPLTNPSDAWATRELEKINLARSTA